MKRRIAITGMGVVSPTGNDVPTFWENLLAGKSGISFIHQFPTDKLRSDIAGSVVDFDPTQYMSAKEAEIYGRVTHFSLASATQAMRQAGLSPINGENDSSLQSRRTRFGCLMSTGMGSVDIFEEQVQKSAERGPRSVSPYFVPGVMPNAAAALICMRYGLMGPSYSLASACATGTHSIATSALMIEAGVSDQMLAGGAEAATRINTVAGFGNARALSRAVDGDPTKASRPFDKDRNGFVMSEGGGAIVLEAEEQAHARGATPLAYLVGFGMTTDAEHVTRPHSQGLGLQLAIEQALNHAGISSDDIGYINPHATSTPHGDTAEYQSLYNVFGDRLSQIPISATKSLIGHVLGGAGAVESIAVVCSLRDQVLHPSLNIEQLDPEFRLRIVKERQRVSFRYALKCSAGFGGHNCALIFERA